MCQYGNVAICQIAKGELGIDNGEKNFMIVVKSNFRFHVSFLISHTIRLI
jgi:hypothetical protein